MFIFCVWDGINMKPFPEVLVLASAAKVHYMPNIEFIATRKASPYPLAKDGVIPWGFIPTVCHFPEISENSAHVYDHWFYIHKNEKHDMKSCFFKFIGWQQFGLHCIHFLEIEQNTMSDSNPRNIEFKDYVQISLGNDFCEWLRVSNKVGIGEFVPK